VVRTLKIKESHAEKIFDLSLPGFTRGGFVAENLQREADRQAVDQIVEFFMITLKRQLIS
jgi:hypothetical protein